MLYLQPMRAERRARPLANDLSGLRCAHTHAVLAFSGALRLLPVTATPLWRGEQSFCFVKVAEKRVGAQGSHRWEYHQRLLCMNALHATTHGCTLDPEWQR